MCNRKRMNSPEVDDIRSKVRVMVETGAMSRAAISRAAGLHANTLRDCTEPDWNPTADTLAKLSRFLREHGGTPVLASAEEIIDEARNGRMFILVDDENRENEGDLVIPAQMATPSAINFMATHGRGLICLSLSATRVEQLGLQPMSRENRTRHETAFTTSIEAREGVTTGISAADRARTISVAIDSARSADDLVTPGHVFPLKARDGGVLTRAGHTEAAVDISRLAGLNPSGVICEIMNDDGSMARMDDLIAFACRHDLRIGTIRDLIAYRWRHDRQVKRQAETRFRSRAGGIWTSISFHNEPTGDEMMALVYGHIDADTPTLVRMHTFNPFHDLFEEESPRSRLVARAMEIIAAAGAGVIVMINRRVPGQLTRAIRARQGSDTREDLAELRDYGVGAQILADLGVHQMILLSNSHHSLVALEGYGLSVVGERGFGDAADSEQPAHVVD